MKTLLSSAKSIALLGALAIYSVHAQAALQITNVTVQAPTTSSSGILFVTGTCNAAGGSVSMQIKLQGSGTWQNLGSGAGNCNNPGPKTVQVTYTQPPGNYKIKINQGSSFHIWPATVVLP